MSLVNGVSAATLWLAGDARKGTQPEGTRKRALAALGIGSGHKRCHRETLSPRFGLEDPPKLLYERNAGPVPRDRKRTLLEHR